MSGRRLLTFFAGDERFAASATDVSEVFRPPRITRIPHGPPSLLGIAGLRGAPAPVISLARLLGREAVVGEAQRLLLLASEPPIGLMVDRVGALTEAPADAAPEPGRKAGFGGLYATDGEAYRLLDLEALLQRDFAGVATARPTALASEPEAETAAETTVALLAFDLGGQAYALPLDEVAEVLPAPPQLALIAQSDDAVLGVMTLRGAVLPIVSAKALLGLAETDRAEKVVVARIGPARVGLAVDRLRSILRAPETSIDAAPAVLNRGEGEAQVQSICRLPDGGGLVAILSAERLFRDEKVAHILADSRSEVQDMTAATDMAAGEQVLVFRLGDEEYGLPLSAVDEVARLPERLTRVPRAPAFVEGVLNLRGKVTPIIDQRRRFGTPAAQTRARTVVTTIEGRQAGFIVDAVSEIVQLAPGQIEATPELAAEAGRLFSRIASLDEGRRLILLIEPQELLDRAERDLLAALDASAATTPS